MSPLDYPSVSVPAAGPAGLSQNNITLLILILLILLAFSAIVSGAEVAFFSLNNRDLNLLRARKNRHARTAAQLLEKPGRLQASLTIISCLVNIGFILVADFLIDQMIPFKESFIASLLIKIVMITSVLLLFGQVLPRIYATRNALRTALFGAPSIHACCRFFDPVSRLYESASLFIEKKLSRGNPANLNFEQIDEAIESTVNESATVEERNILKGIVEFGNITVKQIMKTRLDVSGINESTTFPELIGQVSEWHYSRLPVYHQSLDHITGMIHAKDLLPFLDNPEGADWHELIRPPYFVHEQKLIEDLLREFQSRHIHFAVVVDEFGGTSGIVTLEDILEEVIGDIRDEFDEEDQGYIRLEDHTYIFDGKMMLNDVCRVIGVPPEAFEGVRGESDSIGGLILELAGEFPETNTVIPCMNFEFTVLEVGKMRVRKVKMTIHPLTEENS